MTEGIRNEEMITFNPNVVAERMAFLEEFKPKTWKTYLVVLAQRNDKYMIDFTKQVPRQQLSDLNRLFDIDAVDFFTSSDEDFKNIFSLRLRPEED